MSPPSPTSPLIPSSDASGTVLAVGPPPSTNNTTTESIRRFQPGDKVITLFNQRHISGPLKPSYVSSSLGATQQGCLRQFAIFPSSGLVHAPRSLSLLDVSTLPCAGLTAWNCLYGLRPLQAGETVLTQGTGGVSLFAASIAKAAGARVVSTTSDSDGKKGDVLRNEDVDLVIDYKKDQQWGKTAKEWIQKITATEQANAGHEDTREEDDDNQDAGIDHVIEVSGPLTISNSFTAIKPSGIISIIGFLGGVKAKPTPNPPSSSSSPSSTTPPQQQQPRQAGFVDCLTTGAIVRGVMVGSRDQLEDLVQAIDKSALAAADTGDRKRKIRPVIDSKIWQFEDLKEAYQYMWEQKHLGKVVVKVSDEGQLYDGGGGGDKEESTAAKL